MYFTLYSRVSREQDNDKIFCIYTFVYTQLFHTDIVSETYKFFQIRNNRTCLNKIFVALIQEVESRYPITYLGRRSSLRASQAGSVHAMERLSSSTYFHMKHIAYIHTASARV